MCDVIAVQASIVWWIVDGFTAWKKSFYLLRNDSDKLLTVCHVTQKFIN